MARELGTGAAINEAIAIAMRSDPNVILMGEDVAGGGNRSTEGAEEMGGVLGITRGLVGEFGMNRVRDTPIAEMGLLGTAVGAAATGLRPIAELMFMDFIGTCLDPLLNQASKLPLHVRRKGEGAAHHSHRVWCGDAGGRPAFPIPVLDDDGDPRPQDGDPVFTCRGQGPAARLDPGRRSGDLLRGQGDPEPDW